jgi:integrase
VRQHVGKTKTEASKNIIPVDEHLLADLRAWRSETPYAENGDYIFASPKMKGKQPLWLDTVIKKTIKPAAAKAGIRLKGWHTLRHSYSTLLKANGNDPKVVQELLRHAKLATTMDGYTQALSPDKRRTHRGVIRLVVPRQAPRKLVAALSV